MLDLFSRYVHGVVLPDENAPAVCTSLLKSWILRSDEQENCYLINGLTSSPRFYLIFASFCEFNKIQLRIRRRGMLHERGPTRLLNMTLGNC